MENWSLVFGLSTRTCDFVDLFFPGQRWSTEEADRLLSMAGLDTSRILSCQAPGGLLSEICLPTWSVAAWLFRWRCNAHVHTFGARGVTFAVCGRPRR